MTSVDLVIEANTAAIGQRITWLAKCLTFLKDYLYPTFPVESLDLLRGPNWHPEGVALTERFFSAANKNEVQWVNRQDRHSHYFVLCFTRMWLTLRESHADSNRLGCEEREKVCNEVLNEWKFSPNPGCAYLSSGDPSSECRVLSQSKC